MHLDDSHKYIPKSNMNIHNHIHGKTMEMALTDGKALVLRATDGHEYRIEWIDGEPVLVSINVLIKMPALSTASSVGVF